MTVTSLLNDPKSPKQTPTLLCKDCIHYQHFRSEGEHVCGRRAKLLNPVSGEVIHHWENLKAARCSAERNYFAWFAKIFGFCGSKAQYFEKRQS